MAIGFIPTRRLADRFGESELTHAFAAEPDAALPQALPADVAKLVAAMLPVRLRLPAPPDSAWCLRDGAAFVPTRAETLAAREARGAPARTSGGFGRPDGGHLDPAAAAAQVARGESVIKRQS